MTVRFALAAMVLAAAGVHAAPPACMAVASDRILARDLAAAEPSFSSVPPETEIGYAPAPGARRVFSAGEVSRLAARFGVTLPAPHEFCIEQEMEALTAQRIRQAVEKAVPQTGAQIEVTGWSRFLVPHGELEFPPAGLSAPVGSEAPALWRGYVRYGSNRRFGVWASVRISVAAHRVVAAENLPAGRAISPDAVRVETVRGFPFGPRPADAIEQVAGRIPRRRIAAGSPIFGEQLDEAHAVEAGQTVSVEVESGEARLRFQGQAEAPGRVGDWIAVRNPASGKTFRARVAGTGKTLLEVGGEHSLK